MRKTFEEMEEFIQNLANTNGLNSKTKLLDMEQNIIFMAIDTNGFCKYKVYDIKHESLDFISDSTDFSDMLQTFTNRVMEKQKNNYIKIYRNELQSDKIFDEYCTMENAVILEKEDAVLFYTLHQNNVPSEHLEEED